MPILQTSPFLERLLRFLIPYFTGVSADMATARAEALETLIAYGARTRAELLCAAQIIVFSFAALDTLAESNMATMSCSMRIRFRGCANNLNRQCQKTEQTLAKRLACDAPGATDAHADPIDDIPEDVAEEIMRRAQAEIHAARDRAATKTQAHAAQLQNKPLAQNKPIQGKSVQDAAMPHTVAEIGKPMGIPAAAGMPIQPKPTPDANISSRTP